MQQLVFKTVSSFERLTPEILLRADFTIGQKNSLAGTEPTLCYSAIAHLKVDRIEIITNPDFMKEIQPV